MIGANHRAIVAAGEKILRYCFRLASSTNGSTTEKAIT
jgi:hypothetical protein